jgi:hypothetical protein
MKTKSGRSRQHVLKLAAALAMVGSLAALVSGATFGLYSSEPSPATDAFTAGTITLTNNVTGACRTTSMAPGDSPAACMLGLTYSGSLSAYLAVDILIETQAGTGGTDLYNPPSSNNGLTVSITDNQGTPVTYTVPTTATTCPSGAPTGSTCYELDNELLGTSPYTSGATDTISTSVTLPSAAGNGYQGGSAQIILTAHAVQAKNNTMHCTTTPTAGQSCTASSGFAWS